MLSLSFLPCYLALINKNIFKVVEIASKAPTRKKLYSIIQKEYDLANYGPCMTTEYLKEVLKPDCKWLRVPRSETSPIPKGVKRCFHSFEAFKLLCEVLE